MCEHCEPNKKEGNKFCKACGAQVNEKMNNDYGCQYCKCDVECDNNCDVRRKVVIGRQTMPFKCGHQIKYGSYCPNCGKPTRYFINRIHINTKMAYKIAVAKDFDDLFSFIGTSDPRAKYNGPVIFRVLIWDGRVVQAKNNNGVENAARTNKVIFFDAEALKPAVEKMISCNETFITVNSNPEICSLEWSIHNIK